MARKRNTTAALPAWASAGGDVFGRSAELIVVHRAGKRTRRATGRIGASVKSNGRTRSSELLAIRVADRLNRSFDGRRVADLLAGVGHVQRLAILSELLRGPATYAQLVKATGQESGPLYHHVNKLRLAGLARTVARDLYALTPLGEDVTVALMALDKLVGRARPS